MPILKTEDEAVAPGGTQHFGASYDRTTKLISGGAIALGIAFIVVTKSLIVAGLWLALMVFAWAYSPRRFAVVERSVVVRRLVGNVRIPLEQLREARPATGEDFRGCIRLWGNGGLFGYYGLFRTSRLGRCSFYLTRRNLAVVITTAAKTAVLSPDDSNGFLEAIRAQVPVPQLTPGQTEAGSSRSGGLTESLGRIVGGGIGVLAVAVVALALLYSPGPPSYSLTQDGLTIHDRFYPVTLSAAGVDLDRSRVVDSDADAEWRVTLRTNGFSNFHYHSGWYRAANGQEVRMYRADGNRLVLLAPKGNGTTVLMEVAEPEQFLGELRAKWSQR